MRGIDTSKLAPAGPVLGVAGSTGAHISRFVLHTRRFVVR